MKKILTDITVDILPELIQLQNKKESFEISRNRKKIDLSGILSVSHLKYKKNNFWRLWLFYRQKIKKIKQGFIIKRKKPHFVARNIQTEKTVSDCAISLREKFVTRTKGSTNIKQLKTLIYQLGLIMGIFLVLQLLVSGWYLKEQVSDKSYTGFSNLLLAKNAVASVDINQAVDYFKKASLNFQEAQSEVNKINYGINLINGSPLDTADKLLSIGDHIANSGKSFSQGVNSLGINQNVKSAFIAFEYGINELQKACTLIQGINMIYLPAEHQDTFADLQKNLPFFLTQLQEVQKLFPVILDIFGDNYPRRYLIIFQNTAESRGTGGFIGGGAILDYQKGKVVRLEPFDIYTLDWRVFEEVPAPRGLQSFMQNIHMRDANYLPDFAEASYYLNWFYERCGESSLDGVIAIDETMLEGLLEIIGEVEMAEYDLTLNANNYFETLQYWIETNKDHPETPKQILLDLIPLIKKRVENQKPWAELTGLLLQAIETKHLQIHLFNEKNQDLIEKIGANRNFVPDNHQQLQDFLAIINSNGGGNKVDRLISQAIKQKTQILDNGDIINQLTIQRKHNWSEQEKLQIYQKIPQLLNLPLAEQERLLFILGDSPDRNFTRVFVPLGSELISVKGIEQNDILVHAELDKTIFGFLWTILPSETSEITLTYKLPFSLNINKHNNYGLVFQKQSGRDEDQLIKEIELAPNFKLSQDYPTSIQNSSDFIRYESNTMKDSYFSTIIIPES